MSGFSEIHAGASIDLGRNARTEKDERGNPQAKYDGKRKELLERPSYHDSRGIPGGYEGRDERGREVDRGGIEQEIQNLVTKLGVVPELIGKRRCIKEKPSYGCVWHTENYCFLRLFWR